MKDLTTGNEFKTILFFAIPMLIGNLFQQFYNMADSIIVGNFLGKTALGAVGASFPVVFLLLSFVTGIGNGASVLVSQFFGAKQFHKLRETVDTFYILLAIVCVAVTAGGVLGAEWVLRLMNTPPEMLPEAKSYMIIFISGIVFLFGFNGFTSLLNGLGDSKTPLYFLSIATVMNILLDLLFVPVLKMGVDGAAYATNACSGSHQGAPTAEERAFLAASGGGTITFESTAEQVGVALNLDPLRAALAVAGIAALAIGAIAYLRRRGAATA